MTNEENIDKEYIQERYSYNDDNMNDYLKNSNNPNLYYTDSLASPIKPETENLKNPNMTYTDTLANPNNIYSPNTNKLYEPYEKVNDNSSVEVISSEDINAKVSNEKYKVTLISLSVTIVVLIVVLLVIIL